MYNTLMSMSDLVNAHPLMSFALPHKSRLSEN
jgi:hypothetical protein